MLLGYDDERDFASIDWAKDLGTERVRIVVPIVAIHELDGLKGRGSNQQRSRARQALRWLIEWLPRPDRPNEIAALAAPSGRVSIEVYVDEGPTRRDDADGDIIRVTGQIASRTECPTVLVTRDLAMTYRAGAAGVNATRLDLTS